MAAKAIWVTLDNSVPKSVMPTCTFGLTTGMFSLIESNLSGKIPYTLGLASAEMRRFKKQSSKMKLNFENRDFILTPGKKYFAAVQFVRG